MIISNSLNPLKISVFGAGYVGLVTGACLADLGHFVCCIDSDANKISGLQRGEIPIYERGLEDLVQKNSHAMRLRFSQFYSDSSEHADLIFVAVGTPKSADGSADLSAVNAVAALLGRTLTRSAIVVIKSTVPVGTADEVKQIIRSGLSERGLMFEPPVVSNPEFLQMGDAVKNCQSPDRIILGSDSQSALMLMKALYAPQVRSDRQFLLMDSRSAELTKYTANAMLATRISFMNEIANIAERVGANIEAVKRGIGSDPRIGFHFINPGAGYGGSCFPKDVQALAHIGNCVGYPTKLLDAVHAVNEAQTHRLAQIAKHHFNSNLRGKVFAVWGLAFKPNTDDMRDAPSRVLITDLLAMQATVKVYDPVAMEDAKRLFEGYVGIEFCRSKEEALIGSSALFVVTEWEEFKALDFDLLRVHLGNRVVFDGRNIYQPQQCEANGIAYYGIGYGRSSRAPGVSEEVFSVRLEKTAVLRAL